MRGINLGKKKTKKSQKLLNSDADNIDEILDNIEMKVGGIVDPESTFSNPTDIIYRRFISQNTIKNMHWFKEFKQQVEHKTKLTCFKKAMEEVDKRRKKLRRASNTMF